MHTICTLLASLFIRYCMPKLTANDLMLCDALWSWTSIFVLFLFTRATGLAVREKTLLKVFFCLLLEFFSYFFSFIMFDVHWVSKLSPHSLVPAPVWAISPEKRAYVVLSAGQSVTCLVDVQRINNTMKNMNSLCTGKKCWEPLVSITRSLSSFFIFHSSITL